MKKEIKESFVVLDEELFYKIENYDQMEDFFMTITSSSDIWNFLWSKGGITAGRKNADHAVFQYATSDKVSDFKYTTGPYTLISIKDGDRNILWEPFVFVNSASLISSPDEDSIQYNIYKNINGSKIWFEEVNSKLGLAYRYGWTSSRKYGLVKMSKIINLTDDVKELKVLDGARNVMPSMADSGTQINSSVLLDAYKKTDVYADYNMALFSLSSAVSDKAEPSEDLLTNVCWFTTNDDIHIDPALPSLFRKQETDGTSISRKMTIKGGRPASYIVHSTVIEGNKSDNWYTVFDVSLNQSKLCSLKNNIKDRAKAVQLLEEDISDTENLLTQYLMSADGIQDTANSMVNVHHRTNVMFNIMRGGIINDDGKIRIRDFWDFVKIRNTAAWDILNQDHETTYLDRSVLPQELYNLISKYDNADINRLFMEYLPVKFSRRHGDPSRPWNKFNIELLDKNNKEILNYEGNWRDIFQNWEALLYSYPEYISNVTAKFLNAMTMDGFNPYRISREGIDWECPEEGNPWSSYGYWGDHQVIYLQKLLELFVAYDKEYLSELLSKNIFSVANVPYRLKPYSDICNNPRDTLIFDRKLSDKLFADSKISGSDMRLVLDKEGKVEHLTMTAKILQILVSKICNLVPAGGIWMNTQRPEWNDANNALAGWGLSVVTTCYLKRMLGFLINLYEEDGSESYMVPHILKNIITQLISILSSADDKIYTDGCIRKSYVDTVQGIYEMELKELYVNYYHNGFAAVDKKDILEFLRLSDVIVTKTISANKTKDGLYHSYNILSIKDDSMDITNLQVMLEGQVAVLSSGILSSQEVISLYDSLKSSALYESRQNSYMLYPNKERCMFFDKNNVSASDAVSLESYLDKDEDGVYHFDESCQNQRLLKEWLCKNHPEADEAVTEKLCILYEKTFDHSKFTGRSGSFFAYEGLGSIYWHMVSKLILAVQENAVKAFRSDDINGPKLTDIYYELKEGLGAAKSADLYGAFPFDPYSHTPSMQGAKQPGMTGQVKEEVLTRWGELGVSIEDGCACFNPIMLNSNEFIDGKYLSFYWCGTKITYEITEGEEKTVVYFSDDSVTEQPAEILSREISGELFSRSGVIKEIFVQKKREFLYK